MEYLKLCKEYLAAIEAQRDDVKFAVHTSPDGEPTIMSKKQFGDLMSGYTGGYLRAYPYNDVKVKDVIVQKQYKGEPDIKFQGTTSSPLSNPFSKEKYIQRFRERRKY